MPYNPYYSPGYQPQVPLYPSAPQNIQPQQPQTPGGGLIWVQGENGAKSYLLAPSTAIIDVPRGCCFTLSVRYVSGVTGDAATVPTPEIEVINSNLTISRIA